MSHFYGTVQGGRGEGTRCGHKSSGLRTVAKSWHASITVFLSHDEKTGQDMAWVVHQMADGKSVTIYAGPLGGPDAPPDLVGPKVSFTLDEIEKAQELVRGE